MSKLLQLPREIRDMILRGVADDLGTLNAQQLQHMLAPTGQFTANPAVFGLLALTATCTMLRDETKEIIDKRRCSPTIVSPSSLACQGVPSLLIQFEVVPLAIGSGLWEAILGEGKRQYWETGSTRDMQIDHLVATGRGKRAANARERLSPLNTDEARLMNDGISNLEHVTCFRASMPIFSGTCDEIAAKRERFMQCYDLVMNKYIVPEFPAWGRLALVDGYGVMDSEWVVKEVDP